MKAKEFDQHFEDGENLVEYLDLQGMLKPEQAIRRINVDFPKWMIDSLDKEARRLGVPRQSIIITWLADRLRVGRQL